MGLDMFLRGEKYFWTDWNHPENDLTEDGYRLKSKELELELELGYWRKEPNLHGYIVQKFAGGEDECQRIDLTENDMLDIIDAVENDRLPETTGFFFGRSADPNNPDEKEWAENFKKETIETFRKAIEWTKAPDEKHRTSRDVYYQASW